MWAKRWVNTRRCRLLTFTPSDVRRVMRTYRPKSLHGMNVGWIDWTEEDLAQHFAFAGTRHIPLDDFHAVQLW